MRAILSLILVANTGKGGEIKVVGTCNPHLEGGGGVGEGMGEGREGECYAHETDTVSTDAFPRHLGKETCDCGCNLRLSCEVCAAPPGCRRSVVRCLCGCSVVDTPLFFSTSTSQPLSVSEDEWEWRDEGGMRETHSFSKFPEWMRVEGCGGSDRDLEIEGCDFFLCLTGGAGLGLGDV